MLYSQKKGMVTDFGQRPTFLTTMRGFSLDGSWISRGFSARFRGVLPSFRQHSSHYRRLCSRQKTVMNLSLVNVMGGNWYCS